jgi:hypothetical protein
MYYNRGSQAHIKIHGERKILKEADLPKAF